MTRYRDRAELGIVVGLESEARIARRLSGRVVCSGGRSDAADRLAQTLAESGVGALVSFGIAGGLAPDLAPGSLVIADRVISNGIAFPAAYAWAGLLGATVGTIFGDSEIASTVLAKSAIRSQTGALAVDLESGPVARAAAEAGLPFVALRAIADPAWRALPRAALLPLDAAGRPRLGPVFRSIVAHPVQIPALIAIARDTAAALKALAQACRVLAAQSPPRD